LTQVNTFFRFGLFWTIVLHCLDAVADFDELARAGGGTDERLFLVAQQFLCGFQIRKPSRSTT
jgi:hypothetical protein